MNQLIYENVNNGVYKSGFALTQKAYDTAITQLFETLDHLEKVLSQTKFLVGNEFTEADLIIGQSYSRNAGVHHNVINKNEYEFRFIEVELKK